MIFGADSRVKINLSTQEVGYFVQLISTYADGYQTQSSGVLIGSNDVLTAAHALYDNAHGGYAQEVVVTPSKFGTYEPYSNVAADALFVSYGWQDYELSYYDYGVVSLSSAVGFSAGWLEFAAVAAPSAILGSLLTSYGYAGDLQSGDWLYKTTGTPDGVYTNHLLTFKDDLDTYFGQSGSPVIYEDEVIAIIVSQFEDSNNALLISDTIYQDILNAISQNNQNLTAQESSVTLQDSVTALYIAFFNRAPDYEGLEYWMQKAQMLQDQNDITKQIASQFASHEIFSQTYDRLDDAAFVEAVYQNILGTSGDSAGMEYWQSSLDTKERYFVVDEIIKATLSAPLQSEEFAYLTYDGYKAALQRQNTFANKVEVASAFTARLDLLTNITLAEDLPNDEAYLASQNILLNITDDETLTQERVDYIVSIQESQTAISDINTTSDLWV